MVEAPLLLCQLSRRTKIREDERKDRENVAICSSPDETEKKITLHSQPGAHPSREVCYNLRAGGVHPCSPTDRKAREKENTQTHEATMAGIVSKDGSIGELEVDGVSVPKIILLLSAF